MRTLASSLLALALVACGPSSKGPTAVDLGAAAPADLDPRDLAQQAAPNTDCGAPAVCHQFAVGCDAGAGQCVACNLDDGTSCGTNKFCHGGQCNDCTPGDRCTYYEPCHFGVLDCTMGYPNCVNGGNLKDGTPCGFNRVCAAGACPP